MFQFNATKLKTKVKLYLTLMKNAQLNHNLAVLLYILFDKEDNICKRLRVFVIT